MRYTTGGVAHMAAVIEDDLQDRDTGLHKPHVKDWRIYRQACLPAAA